MIFVNKTRLSIIVPFYNNGKEISSTLSSVAKAVNSEDASSFFVEVVIVDDGSSESENAELRQAIELCRINAKLIVKLNGGVSSARNVGLENSSGEYIYFLDADDQLHPLFFSRIKADLALSPMSDAIWGTLAILKKEIRPCYSGMQTLTYDSLANLFNTRAFHLSCLLFSRNAIDNTRFDARYKNGEDHLFIISCLHGKAIYFSGSVLGSYMYDGKFHKATDSAYEEILRIKDLTPIAYGIFYNAYNERKYLHNCFFNEKLSVEKNKIKNGLRIIGSIKSRFFYQFIQNIRFKLLS